MMAALKGVKTVRDEGCWCKSHHVVRMQMMFIRNPVFIMSVVLRLLAP